MTLHRSIALSVVLAVTLSAALAVEGGDWSQYRGPHRNGVSSETGLLRSWPASGPEIAWRVALGEGYSGIAVQGERVYTLYGREGDEWAAAFEAASGKEVWRTRLDANRPDGYGGGPRSTPTVEGDLVFALGASGKLAALSAAGGEVRWRKDLVAELGARVPRWGVASSPIVEGDLLLVEVGGKGTSGIVAFDKKTGKPAWSTPADRPGYSSPLVATLAGARQAVFFTGAGLMGLAPSTGTVLWSYPWETSYDVNAAMPVLAEPDRLFISSGYDTGAALLRVKGEGGREIEEIWKSRVMKNHFNSSVLHAGHLYGFDDGTLKCIRLDTQEEKWAQRGFAKGSLLVADGHLFILGEKGLLALAEATPEAYKEKARHQLLDAKTWTMPSLSRGRLYVRSEAELLALKVSG
jgi:outer membrane protein assembly factor BamB